ncbi:MAG: hypothetical protein IPG60_07230 [Bacteroidetes bacterium]|nr:hypothetical protein [Bacteroidota bacterium]MBP7400376.1 hypothetical protein [Chitinophagales bacterium]MBK8488210.1 hypothetical protein [Bacteroidota bacterium]MBK8682029.1 hypothetical protein [Bacteroidota bacterium]MBP8753803.1 hypothetical protein [Chitinophagales bacterium]
MDKRQESVRSMYIAVRDYLVTNTAIWTASTGMTNGVATLTTYIDTIDTYSQGQQADTKGITNTKGEKRDSLVSNILSVAGALVSYGKSTANSTLIGQAKVTKSQLDGMADTILSDKALTIRNLGNTNIAGLADFNILPADITALQAARVAFNADIQKPKNVIGTKKASTTALKDQFDGANLHLELSLDQLIRTYNATEHDFVLGYFNNRTIFNIGSEKVAVRFIVDDSVDHLPLGLVKILVTPGDIQKKTTEKGNAQIKTLADGTYNVEFSRPGFVTQNATFYITFGATTNVVASMVAV